MPAACRSSCRGSSTALVVNCGLPAINKRELAAGGARDRRAFDRHLQRHLVVPFPRIAARCSAAARRADRRRPARRAGRRARIADGASCCAPRTTAMPTDFGVIHQRALRLARRRPRARRRGQLHAAARRAHAGAARRRIRHPLSSASGGQGQPPGGRPRRHAGAAGQGGVDLHRLRGAGRARGKRLSSPAPTARAAPCRS